MECDEPSVNQQTISSRTSSPLVPRGKIEVSIQGVLPVCPVCHVLSCPNKDGVYKRRRAALLPLPCHHQAKSCWYSPRVELAKPTTSTPCPPLLSQPVLPPRSTPTTMRLSTRLSPSLPATLPASPTSSMTLPTCGATLTPHLESASLVLPSWPKPASWSRRLRLPVRQC